jgi:coenzyme Q-binding protein COQ10
MPRHTDSKVLPFTPEQLFDLVADVARYPEFLPWVIGSRVRTSSQTEMVADIVVGFKIFRESFTSKVTLQRPAQIHVDYINGPLKYLRNEWQFSSVDGGCRVDFLVDFEFKNRLFETMVGGLFTEAVRRMVAAFEKRAVQVYGVPKNTVSPTRNNTQLA